MSHGVGDAFVEDNVKLGCLERRRHFVFDDLYFYSVADDLLALLFGPLFGLLS